jgi:hypothetical protein
MDYRKGIFILLIVILMVACTGPTTEVRELTSNPDITPDEDRSGCIITSPPAELEFDPFYTKYCDADGIPIISSEEVDNLALQQAYYIINNMLAPIPETRAALVEKRYYVGIIGRDQEQTTLPEYAHMDSEYWDQRARGLGAGPGIEITSCGEENLLCLGRGQDKYHGENILVHEFAHTIHLSGMGKVFNTELQNLYYAALKAGLWDNTYAATDHLEYWAEGVQSYFNTNLSSHLGDGVHNYVNTRQELYEYDPALYGFITDFFQDFSWTPTCPK